MSSPAQSPPIVLLPFAWVGRGAMDLTSYAGGLTLMLLRVGPKLLFPPGGLRGWFRALNQELGWMLAMGLPLVGLVHVGIGSFLAMQAYFGGTFVDGTGAVVGVGLVRNVAPQMACLTLCGILAARIVPDLRARSRRHDESDGADDLDSAVAFRILAALISGVVLSVWGAAVGIVVGWRVGVSMMGVTTHSFFLMFWEMLWWRDIVGLAVKGVFFGMAAVLFACHEGLRLPPDETDDDLPTAACRAACLAALSVLVGNSSWFLLAYHAGPMFGPTLLTPPTT